MIRSKSKYKNKSKLNTRTWMAVKCKIIINFYKTIKKLNEKIILF